MRSIDPGLPSSPTPHTQSAALGMFNPKPLHTSHTQTYAAQLWPTTSPRGPPAPPRGRSTSSSRTTPTPWLTCMHVGGAGRGGRACTAACGTPQLTPPWHLARLLGGPASSSRGKGEGRGRTLWPATHGVCRGRGGPPPLAHVPACSHTCQVNSHARPAAHRGRLHLHHD